MCEIVQADAIRILKNVVVLVVFDFYLRMEIMANMLFLSEVVTFEGHHKVYLLHCMVYVYCKYFVFAIHMVSPDVSEIV